MMFSIPHAVWVQCYCLGIPSICSDFVDVEKVLHVLGGVH